MTAIQRELNTSEFSNDQLDRFLFALMGRMKVHYINGVEQPMTKKQLASFLGYTTSGINKLVKAGVIRAHRIDDGADPRYFASEVVERLKAS
jgi:hypothetical protein